MAKAGQDPKQTQKTEQLAPEEQLKQLQQQLTEKEEAYRRALADYRNLQQQAQQDRARIIQMAASGVLEELLPTLDHLEMALQHFPDPSLQMIADSLRQVLQRHGLVQMEVLGRPFNHQIMEAVDTTPGPKDEVLEVRRPGYTLHNNVLRHAQVIVGSGEENV